EARIPPLRRLAAPRSGLDRLRAAVSYVGNPPFSALESRGRPGCPSASQRPMRPDGSGLRATPEAGRALAGLLRRGGQAPDRVAFLADQNTMGTFSVSQENKPCRLTAGVLFLVPSAAIGPAFRPPAEGTRPWVEFSEHRPRLRRHPRRRPNR